MKQALRFKRRIKSFSYAIKGIIQAFKGACNIWIHLLAAILVIIAGFIFDISSIEWLAIVLCIGMVFACEIINTAIEKIVDFISPEFNKKAGLIKDLAAGAVLITAIMSVVVSVIIFVPKIPSLF